MHKLKVKLLVPYAIAPKCANPGEDLGYDLFALEDTTIRGGHRPTLVRTGIAARAVDVDDPSRQFGLLIRDRSSMASKGLFTHGGVIDAGYTGEIKVLMDYPCVFGDYEIKAGDKIAQMIPVEVITGETIVVDELPTSARGEGGFGSTGK